MVIKRHGLSIGIERTGSEFFLTLKAVGKLTHEDYATITPLLESALERVQTPTVKALVDGTEMEGWDARAAWDDFRLGLKHNREFERIAIVGNKKWQEWAARLGSWFSAGEVKYFEDFDKALRWLDK